MANVEAIKQAVKALRETTMEQSFGGMGGAFWNAIEATDPFDQEFCSACALGVIAVDAINKGVLSFDKMEEQNYMPILEDYLGVRRDYLWRIVNWNDQEHLSFNRIADKIEEDYLTPDFLKPVT